MPDTSERNKKIPVLQSRSLDDCVRVLSHVANYISPSHTHSLATGYLGLRQGELEYMQQDYKYNYKMVTIGCLRRFLLEGNSQTRLYELLKQAGIEQGIVPKIALDIFEGILFYIDSEHRSSKIKLCTHFIRLNSLRHTGAWNCLQGLLAYFSPPFLAILYR